MVLNHQLRVHIEKLKHQFQRIEALRHELQPYSDRSTNTEGEVMLRLRATNPYLANRLLTEIKAIIEER
ncbi:MAG: hypothetical protein ACXV7J_15155 [Methylomonas sp.]